MSSNVQIEDIESYLREIKVTPLNEVIRLRGKVVHGFGRGSKMLGFPTANLDPKAFNDQVHNAERGVYIGFAQLKRLPKEGDAAAAENDGEVSEVFHAMLSVGTSPQFNDQVEDTVEAYIYHEFECDFYGDELTLLICGYVRPMGAYKTLDDLIAVIKNDVRLGNEALVKEEYSAFKADEWFHMPPQ